MDNTTSDIPREVADVIISLNVIAGIPTNRKLNTLKGTYVDADSLIDAFFRLLDKESRNTTVDYINKKIDEAIEVCKKYPAWATEIADRVANIANALVNLEQLYKRKQDEIIVGKINMIKLRVDRIRFLRTCHAIAPTSSSPVTINQSSSPISTGLTPLLQGTLPNKPLPIPPSSPAKPSPSEDNPPSDD